MKQKQEPGRETKQKRAFSAIMGTALLFLGVVLAVNLVGHLQANDVFAAIISALGALLFFAVGVILFSDLFRRKKPPVNPAETKDEEA